jgi:hypothetical protein
MGAEGRKRLRCVVPGLFVELLQQFGRRYGHATLQKNG